MVLASRVGAHMTDNSNPSTKAAVAVVAKERLTSSWWVLLSLLAPLALFHSLRYEFSFMVGNTSLDKVPPGCSVLSTHFPGLRLNAAFFKCHLECVLVALPGPASGSVSVVEFPKQHPLWKAIVRHTSYIPRPSKLGFHKH